MDSISENAVAMEKKHDHPAVFIPAIRSGEWSDIGKRVQMEDTHICIADLAKKFGFAILDGQTVSFYGVSDKELLC
uniref:Uncharacterized protein n=1 Tax=Nymphaea colorata TaxID=210225 RepID=A0A5K1BVZ5_9MAGN